MKSASAVITYLTHLTVIHIKPKTNIVAIICMNIQTIAFIVLKYLRVSILYLIMGSSWFGIGGGPWNTDCI